VSTYDIDGFFNALLEANTIAFPVKSAMIPATAAVQLTTTTLNVLLPGLVSKYGAGLPVDLHVQIISLHDFQIYAGNQEMDCITTLEV
jgi:hypothetical protein